MRAHSAVQTHVYIFMFEHKSIIERDWFWRSAPKKPSGGGCCCCCCSPSSTDNNKIKETQTTRFHCAVRVCKYPYVLCLRCRFDCTVALVFCCCFFSFLISSDPPQPPSIINVRPPSQCYCMRICELCAMCHIRVRLFFAFAFARPRNEM